jgi:protein phosphatase
VKILIISDVHGNAEALNAMTESDDELWVLGDLVNYGPEPAHVIRSLRQRATLIVRGNHDHAVGYDVDSRCSPPFRAMAEATRQHALKTLSEEDKHFLRDLPLNGVRRARPAALSSVSCDAVRPIVRLLSA